MSPLLPSIQQLLLVHSEMESPRITTTVASSRHWEHSFPNDLILYIFSLWHYLAMEVQHLSKKTHSFLSRNSCLLVLTVCTNAKLEIETINIPATTRCGWMVQTFYASLPTFNIYTAWLKLMKLLLQYA